MSCASKSKSKTWVIYDAKEKVFIELTHVEFAEILEDRPVKLVDKKIWNRDKGEMTWIDGLLNSSYFK